MNIEQGFGPGRRKEYPIPGEPLVYTILGQSSPESHVTVLHTSEEQQLLATGDLSASSGVTILPAYQEAADVSVLHRKIEVTTTPKVRGTLPGVDLRYRVSPRRH